MKVKMGKMSPYGKTVSIYAAHANITYLQSIHRFIIFLKSKCIHILCLDAIYLKEELQDENDKYNIM